MTNVLAPQKQLFTSMISLPLSLSPLSLFVHMMLNVNRNPKAYSRNGEKGRGVLSDWGRGRVYIYIPIATLSPPGFQARSKDLEILDEGGGAGPSLLHRRDDE